eukprot:CAMPEP_0172439898 /NCGR_PEP_ID=MMETSP1065-20121228/739_1 /TAXON_ID=265537 /ORGANISM="Amphiprora paludosa, Strain CCMP125" /LENGTH=175 /DNA_ID=CAMNT_0013188657 /DNA_START=209 /DNA_END=733 /DNA_ORIENTATION=-
MIQITSESNHSTHSTFAVEQPLKQPLHVSAPQCTSRRTVCFDEDSNEYFDNTTGRAAEDCHETWYTKEDYQQFRSNVRANIRQAQQNQDSTFFKSIQNLYMASRQVTYVLEDATDLLSEKLQAKLAQLYVSEDNMDMIGMEYHVVAAIKQDVRQQRQDIQVAVYEIQQEFDQGAW